jgi:hypothetical protein
VLYRWEEESPKPIEFEAGWDPEPVWTFLKRVKSRYPAGIRTADRPSHNLVTIPTAASQGGGSSRRMERIVQRGFLTKYHYGAQIHEDMMGRACGAYGGEQKLM